MERIVPSSESGQIVRALQESPFIRITGTFTMPYRFAAASELADFLRAIAHPRRIEIIEELRVGEKDVAALQEALGISHSGVSQHLMVLRSHRVVVERRAGRRVLYRLRAPQLAAWLVEGMDLLFESVQESEEICETLRQAKASWSRSVDQMETGTDGSS